MVSARMVAVVPTWWFDLVLILFMIPRRHRLPCCIMELWKIQNLKSDKAPRPANYHTRPSRVSSVSISDSYVHLCVVERKENEERIGAMTAVPKNERSKSKIQTPAVDEQSPLVNK